MKIKRVFPFIIDEKISVVILNNIKINSRRLTCTEQSVDVEGLGLDEGIIKKNF